MASSSNSTNCWKYSVFLSFRGQETRNTLTAHLYHALCNKGINAFIDDKLERGEHITSQLNQIIEDSRISLVIFSQNYARSIYCLDELVKILECKESTRQVVLPVFYNVDPSDVEEQKGSFGESLDFHETYLGINTEKLKQWREALTKAAQLSGWHLDRGNEVVFIRKIVEEVWAQLNHTSLHVAAYQVGLDQRIEGLIHMLNIGSSNVCMVGICGLGGSGKTTVAKAVYNLITNHFEACCCLSNVREFSKRCGLVDLQEKLLFEILGDKTLLLGSVDRGINVIKDRLRHKRVLIVLDDVDHLDQLKQLAGERDWFGSGSKIIITTRDERLLVVHGVERLLRVKELCCDDALMLFCWHAFRNSHPPIDYLEISDQVVKYAKGLPLALVVLGSFLYGRSIPEWESELDKLRRIPNKQIYEVLKISFDGLELHERAIFLDIACFFKGQEKDYVIKILDACDFDPVIGIQVLMEKSLVYIENNKLQMHDLLQWMGRQVVHQESPNVPGRRSRLWFHEDILHVLTENMGSYEVEGLMLDLPEAEEVHLSAKAFEKMIRLRILIVHNAQVIGGPENLPNALRWFEWPGCPLKSMPSTFHARKLVVLNMHHSCIKQLGEGFKNYTTLKYMDFRDCELLTETPDFSTIPNLERLNLEGCTSLVKIHNSVGYLAKLVFLSVEFCSNLESISSHFRLRSLQTLLLTGCSKLEKFPDIEDKMASIERVSLNSTAIKELPSSIENLVGLKVMTLSFCRNLSRIPSSIYKLQHLERLLLVGCSELTKFPENMPEETQPFCFKISMIANNGMMWFPMLTCLDLQNCKLSEVDFLMNLVCFSTLKDLDLSGNNFVNLPTCINRFTKLRRLELANCIWLEGIPELPRSIKRIGARNCTSLETYSELVRVFMFNTEDRSTKLRDLDFSNCHKLADQNPLQSLADTSSRCISVDEGFREDFRIEVVLPGNEIPRWFRLYSDDGYMSFNVPSSTFRRTKALVLCAILRLQFAVDVNISREIFINGRSVISFSRQFFSLKSDHMWLYYLPCRKIRSLNSLLQDDWIHIEVSFRILGAPRNATLKGCGVYLINASHPSSIVGNEDDDTCLSARNDGINFCGSETCTSLSLDLMRSCSVSDAGEFERHPWQPSPQWKLPPTQPGLIVIPPRSIYSPIAQLIHQNSFSRSRDSISKKRDRELGEDHDSSIPETSTKRFQNSSCFPPSNNKVPWGSSQQGDR